MLTWFKQEKIKDQRELVKAKTDFIEHIKKIPVSNINNTPITEKKYTLWERLKRTLGMN